MKLDLIEKYLGKQQCKRLSTPGHRMFKPKEKGVPPGDSIIQGKRGLFQSRFRNQVRNLNIAYCRVNVLAWKSPSASLTQLSPCVYGATTPLSNVKISMLLLL